MSRVSDGICRETFLPAAKCLHCKVNYRAAYERYIHSTAWETLRQRRIQIDGGRCQGCGSRQRLHVHHKTYENFTHEPLTDLVTVCEVCHGLIHRMHELRRGTLWDTTAEFLEIVRSSERKPAPKRQPVKKGHKRRSKRVITEVTRRELADMSRKDRVELARSISETRPSSSDEDLTRPMGLAGLPIPVLTGRRTRRPKSPQRPGTGS